MYDFNPRPPRGERLAQKLSNLANKSFQSTPSARRATCHSLFFMASVLLFQSTPSARRATISISVPSSAPFISIHALREEGDAFSMSLIFRSNLFQSTPSARRATVLYPLFTITGLLFQSTPSARRATMFFTRANHNEKISIHALREEGDYTTTPALSQEWIFQSTPSARRATRQTWSGLSGLCYFNPRPPRGERHQRHALFHPVVKYFNPRPPRGERPAALSAGRLGGRFQSTPSARRATGDSSIKNLYMGISIHALREESDFTFNKVQLGQDRFQSTPSARRATCRGQRLPARGHISIHALREESDHVFGRVRPHHQNFNPRPPRGERRAEHEEFKRRLEISIHALREESDPRTMPRLPAFGISIHALREESDLQSVQ